MDYIPNHVSSPSIESFFRINSRYWLDLTINTLISCIRRNTWKETIFKIFAIFNIYNTTSNRCYWFFKHSGQVMLWFFPYGSESHPYPNTLSPEDIMQEYSTEEIDLDIEEISLLKSQKLCLKYWNDILGQLKALVPVHPKGSILINISIYIQEHQSLIQKSHPIIIDLMAIKSQDLLPLVSFLLMRK